MTIFNRIKNRFQSEPEEQILGYALPELRLLFQKPALEERASLLKPNPKKSSLAIAGVYAFYTELLIDKSDMENFMALVDRYFLADAKRQFQGSVVIQSKSLEGDERLCFLVADEFEGHVVKLATDSFNLLTEIDHGVFAPPPPWIAFKGYNAQWWGGSMHGAQGYYNDNYFFPFFQSLNTEHKKAYCFKYGATSDWEKALALFYDGGEGQ